MIFELMRLKDISFKYTGFNAQFDVQLTLSTGTKVDAHPTGMPNLWTYIDSKKKTPPPPPQKKKTPWQWMKRACQQSSATKEMQQPANSNSGSAKTTATQLKHLEAGHQQILMIFSSGKMLKLSINQNSAR